MKHKPVQRGTDMTKDDRREVEDKDAVWADAKIRPHHHKLRPWHRDWWRRG